MKTKTKAKAKAKKVKFHIRKGDTVKVISGDYKNTVSTVLRMLPRDGKAIVQGVNMIKKRQKPMERGAKGQIIEKEAPIYVSKLMLVDPKTGVASRIRRINGERVLIKSAK